MYELKLQKYLYKLNNINYNYKHPKYNVYMTKYNYYNIDGGTLENLIYLRDVKDENLKRKIIKNYKNCFKEFIYREFKQPRPNSNIECKKINDLFNEYKTLYTGIENNITSNLLSSDANTIFNTILDQFKSYIANNLIDGGYQVYTFTEIEKNKFKEQYPHITSPQYTSDVGIIKEALFEVLMRLSHITYMINCEKSKKK